MLSVTGVMREEGGDMEHDLPVFILSVDRGLSSLVALSVQTTTIPIYTHIILRNASLLLQLWCMSLCSSVHNGRSAKMNFTTCHGLRSEWSKLRTIAMVSKALSPPLSIIKYGSILYVGMVRKKNGGQYKHMASACARTLINVSL